MSVWRRSREEEGGACLPPPQWGEELEALEAWEEEERYRHGGPSCSLSSAWSSSSFFKQQLPNPSGMEDGGREVWRRGEVMACSLAQHVLWAF